jgi:hypothetical protein
LKPIETAEADCPTDVVDRLLWRNAQQILHRHVVRLDGSCRWCGQPTPCAAQSLARRAEEVARLPWHEAWPARNEITSLLPVVSSDRPQRSRTGDDAPNRGNTAAARRYGRSTYQVRTPNGRNQRAL